MPRTPRKTASKARKSPSKRATVPTLAEAVASAIAAHPFDFDAPADAPHLFPNLVAPEGAEFDADAIRVGIAESIARDRASGLSGADLRAKYSGDGCPTNRGLSGPMRRKVLREYGHGSLVARSYTHFADGEARQGSAHARMHGPRAAERAAAALDALAAEQADALDAKQQRKLLRDAGQTVPRDAGKLRAATVALLREQQQEVPASA